LDVYGTDGVLLESYRLPALDPAWMRADSRGRVFLKDGASLVVLQDPTFSGEPCPAMPPVVKLRFADTPRHRSAESNGRLGMMSDETWRSARVAPW